MGDRTAISWTDSSWNPLRGCTRKSTGCKFCYAETVAARFSGAGQPYHGIADRDRAGSKWTGKIELIEHMLDQPLRWRKSRKIFVNSMSDLFHENVRDAWIDRIFAVMALATHHTFQVLTKRADRMRAYMTDPKTPERVWMAAPLNSFEAEWFHGGRGAENPWPLKNVWMGVSVENQQAWDERWPHLAATPAAIRMVSFEPLIGRVDTCQSLRLLGNAAFKWAPDPDVVRPDWWIVGGESGHGARPMHPEWALDLLEQCRALGGAFWFKQSGSCRPGIGDPGAWWPDGITGKGDDLSFWPRALRVQEFPASAQKTAP